MPSMSPTKDTQTPEWNPPPGVHTPRSYSFGLIGYPLGHSLSPQIHAAALHALDLNGEYSLYPVQPLPDGDEALRSIMDRVSTGEIHGLNVTIPHKQAVIPLLGELTRTAEAIGAVNTVFLRNGILVGDNTDAPGFWEDLQRITPDKIRALIVEEPRGIILGAGGSARAVAYALLTHGYQLTIAARRMAGAQELCAQFAAFQDRLSAIELVDLPQIAEGASLIVNTTPVGMHPHPDASPWPQGTPFPADSLIYDLVYNPQQTTLVKEARAASVTASSGLGMLIEQAALAFERWTGLQAPRQAMRLGVPLIG